MLVSISLFFLVGSVAPKVKALARARAQFEAAVPPGSDRAAGTYAMFQVNGSAPVYPVGVSTRRYMIGSGEHGDVLIAERFRMGKVTIDWSLPFVTRPIGKDSTGTLPAHLAAWGHESRPRAIDARPGGLSPRPEAVRRVRNAPNRRMVCLVDRQGRNLYRSRPLRT